MNLNTIQNRIKRLLANGYGFERSSSSMVKHVENGSYRLDYPYDYTIIFDKFGRMQDGYKTEWQGTEV